MKKAGLVVVIVLLFIAMIRIVSLSSSKPNPNPPVTESQSQQTNTTPSDIITPPKESWTYDQNADQMTGKITKWACLDSADQLQFDFPYQGGSTGSICLRKKGEGFDAYFKIDKGQLICDIEGCQVRLKVNGGDPVTMSGSPSNDGDSRFIFFDSYARILAIAKKAKEIRLEALYYQEGRQVLRFAPSEPLDPKW